MCVGSILADRGNAKKIIMHLLLGSPTPMMSHVLIERLSPRYGVRPNYKRTRRHMTASVAVAVGRLKEVAAASHALDSGSTSGIRCCERSRHERCHVEKKSAYAWSSSAM